MVAGFYRGWVTDIKFKVHFEAEVDFVVNYPVHHGQSVAEKEASDWRVCWLLSYHDHSRWYNEASSSSLDLFKFLDVTWMYFWHYRTLFVI